MPTKTWVDGEDFNAVDINSYLQNQVVQGFANASERAAELPTPAVGTVSFLASTGAFEVFTDKTTPPSWRLPWNMPWGLVLSALVYDITITTSTQWLTMHLPTQIPGRFYKIEFGTILVPGSVATLDTRFQTTAGLGCQAFLTKNAGWGHRIDLWEMYSGAVNNDTGVIASVSPGTAGMSYARVNVFDVGPI